MPFSEKIKLEVKKKSAFRCCRCQKIGVEIHHIVPQKDGGTDGVENAAPLCANCHSDYGDNPQKRKELNQMRDWWFEKAEAMHAPSPDLDSLEEKIDALVLAVEDKKDEIETLKATLKEYISLKIDSITPDTSQATSTGIVNLPFFDKKAHYQQEDVSIGEGCFTLSTVTGTRTSNLFYGDDGETM